MNEDEHQSPPHFDILLTLPSVLNQQVVGQPLTVMPLPADPNIILTESEDKDDEPR